MRSSTPDPSQPNSSAGYGSQYGGYPSSQSQSPTQAAIPTPSSGGFSAHSADRTADRRHTTHRLPQLQPSAAGRRQPRGPRAVLAPINYSNPTGGQPSAERAAAVVTVWAGAGLTAHSRA